MLGPMPTAAASLSEPEFFSVTASVAGTLWAITLTLFAFITGGVVRSGVIDRAGVLIVLVVGFLVIVSISNLFLSSMLLAFGELMPSGPREAARIVSAFAVTASFVAAIGLSLLLDWAKLPKGSEESGKDDATLTVLYWICLVFNFVMTVGSWLLTDRGDPNCIVCGFLDAHVDVYVLVAVALGCLVSLLLGMGSMQVSLWIASIHPAPPAPGDGLDGA
jgi:hypothetical protein